MSTNMIIFKSPKYSCFWIWNLNNTKFIDWICTWLKLIFQPESIKHYIKTGNKKYTVQRRKSKINNIILLAKEITF